MRFEQLGWKQQIQILSTLHKMLNDLYFNGELEDVKVDIENLANPNVCGQDEGYINAGCFFKDKVLYISENGEMSQRYKISISNDFINDALANEENCSDDDQKYYLTRTMLHEMIHQYCYQNGIDEGDHNETWQQIAWDHGLDASYKDGLPQREEYLDWYVYDFADGLDFDEMLSGHKG